MSSSVTRSEQSPSRSSRLLARLDDLRGRVGWRARVAIASIALSVTIGTWGPLLALPFGWSVPGWEHFVYQTSTPYCHQLPERSYHVFGHLFPLCTRCTGMWLGITLGVAFAMFVIPKSRWWIGFGLAVLATAASAFDKLREEATRVDAPNVRFVLGILIFAGVTLAVSYDTLAVLLGIGRAIARIPSSLRSRDRVRPAS